MVIKLGIECENQEDSKSQWGVGRMVYNLIKQYTLNPHWQNKFKLYLYFKNKIPEDQVFSHPSLIKKIIGPRQKRGSFNIFYHILLPCRASLDRLNVIFFPSYMMPPLYIHKSVTMLTNDVHYEYTQGTLPFRYKLAYRLFTNWAARFSWRILAISEFCKREVARLFKIKPDRIFVSRLGVNSIEDREPDFSLVPDKKYFMFAAQMFPRRRAKEIIEAFSKVAAEREDIHLVLVGKDKYEPKIIEGLVKSVNSQFGSDRIIWHEFIESNSMFKGLILKTVGLIYLSSSEAFGLPPAEAAFLGVPIMVKDNDLNRELFGSGPFYVADEKNVDSIAKVLREMLDSSEMNSKIDIAKQSISRFTWKTFADNFFTYLDENI